MTSWLHSSRRRAAAALVLSSALVGTAIQAAQAGAPPVADLVSFSTTASVDVTQDLLGITLQAVREGQDAAQVQAQLKAALDAALVEARRSAQEGAMEVRTGNFSLYPRYGKDGRINGWQGQAELVLQGRDSQRVAQTAGRLVGMNITSVGYSVSRQLAEKHEAEVTAQAIRKFRVKGSELATQFGYASYVLKEVSVQAGDLGGGPRPVMYRARAEMAIAADASVPVEAGKTTLSATVSGTVQMLK
jgi:predicted secreted protein